MNWSDFNMWLYGVISALVGGVIILVRKVFTNEKEIQLLKAQLNNMENYRKERDERLESTLVELRSDVKALFKSEKF